MINSKMNYASFLWYLCKSINFIDLWILNNSYFVLQNQIYIESWYGGKINKVWLEFRHLRGMKFNTKFYIKLNNDSRVYKS